MTAPWEMLVVSADLEDRLALTRILEAQNLEPISCSTLHEALEALGKETVGLIFCDKQLADGTYRDLLSAARGMGSKVPIVITSRHADWDEYLEAMRLGAFDVIAVPCRPTDVEWMVIQAKRDERSRSRHVAAAEHGPSTYREAAAGSAS